MKSLKKEYVAFSIALALASITATSTLAANHSVEMMGKAPAQVKSTFAKNVNGRSKKGTRDVNSAAFRAALAKLDTDPKGAIADFTKILEQDPNDCDAYTYRGLAHVLVDEYDAALADAEKGSALDRNWYMPFYVKGLALMSQQKFGPAASAFTSGIKLDSTFTDFYVFRGCAFAYMGNYDDAISDETKAIAASPDNYSAHWYRLLGYFGKQDFKSAKPDAEKMASLHPTWGDPYKVLGICCEGLNDKAGAIAAFKKASDNFKNEGNAEQQKLCADEVQKLG
ncbi:MAG: hypothetical protein JST89_00105 [Cyanobacteria bacterium SZAS-4]|nr:hypothetical protein [Cyanobacteria bacterium SZAS-4]